MSDVSTSDRWFGPADGAALRDVIAALAGMTAAAVRPHPAVDPAATRALLANAAQDGDWGHYEAALARQARRAARQGLDPAVLEASFGALAAQLAPRLAEIHADAPRRLLAALDVLSRLLLRELWVLGREYRSRGEPPRAERAFAPPLDALGDGVIATDESGLVTRMNLAAQKLLGWPLDEARGRPLDEVYARMDPETLAPIPTRVDEVVQRSRVFSLPRHPQVAPREMHPFAVVDSIAPILAEDGSVAGAMLVFREESLERAHGQALEASEARTSAIIEASVDAIIRIDAAGVIKEFNGAAEAMLGYDRDAVIGLGFADLVLPVAVRQRYAEAVARDVATGETQVLGKRNEMSALRSDGREFPVEMVIARIPVEGEVSFTCFLRDLTEAKRAQEALTRSHQQLRALTGRVEAAREEERTRIARELHDELGQQLTAIRMDLGWLLHRGDVLPGEVAHRLTAMSELVDTTFQVVRRLGTELRPGILDDLGLTAAIEWQAREFENRSGIRVDVEAPADVGGLDTRHATAIFRIFQELLTNVGRHAGARTVRARLACGPEGVDFEVRDDGRGIRPEEATNPSSLGLLGIRERAALLGGTFHIEPDAERGTVARLHLPREVRA